MANIGHNVSLTADISLSFFSGEAFNGRHSIARSAADAQKFYQRIESSDIVQLDEKGNVAYRWRGYDYADVLDMARLKLSYEFGIDLNQHQNSFCFSSSDSVIYLSLKYMSRIIKIKYPEGNVLNIYGSSYDHDSLSKNNMLFCNQHSCHLSGRGNLYL